MVNNVYSLDTVGTISHPKLKLERLVQYFIIADFSQTHFYQGQVASLKYIMNNSIEDIEEECGLALDRMLSSYFEEVKVETSLGLTDNESVKALNISISVVDNGKSYLFDKDIYLVNDMLKYNLPHSDEITHYY